MPELLVPIEVGQLESESEPGIEPFDGEEDSAGESESELQPGMLPFLVLCESLCVIFDMLACSLLDKLT